MSSETSSNALVVLCTCPDLALAEQLAGGLVEAGLAACVNILPQIRSIYRWDGKLQNDLEVLLIVKTTGAAYPGLERWLLENHPYDVPEVLALPVTAGADAYLSWLTESSAPQIPGQLEE
jgi:periplasmic divalent cation tolerance protein